MFQQLIQWFDAYADAPGADEDRSRHIEWTRVMPFVLLHASCLFVFSVGFSWFALGLFFVSYLVRLFGITGVYHRYFAHRAYRVGRVTQFILATFGAAATQRGPLWWASHHRHHHKVSDEDSDPHSPVVNSFMWSHVGWFLATGNFRSRLELIKDFAKFPELLFLDRFDTVIPILYGATMFFIGYFANILFPELGTSGLQTLVWGYVVSTVFLYHMTFTINSVSHKDSVGSRRYDTTDHSRNVWWLSPFTFGESWHNNHHHFPASARLGFFWWELDLGYYVIRTLAFLGLASDLKGVPERYLHPQRGTPAESTPAQEQG